LEFLEFRLLVALGVLPALGGCGGHAERELGPQGMPPGSGGSGSGSGGASQGSGAGGAASGGASQGSGAGGAASGGSFSGIAGTISSGAGGTGPIGIGGSFGGTGPNPCYESSWVGSEASGYVQCSRGFIHRPFKGQCAPGGTCITDEDCATPDAYPQVCLCGDTGGTCVQAHCTTDADCNGSFCATSSPVYCYVPPPLACASPTDQCLGSQDCGGGYCEFAPTGRYCSICEGRPFLVDGVARVASTLPSSDWLGSLPIDVSALSPELRQRLAAAWTRTALMEHASVAAFARFSLQLLSLGAPADLVEDSARAMADEIEHAKLAFAVASAYAGEPLGPGPLSVERSLEGMTPLEILILTIREGCVGETIAAAEAAEAALSATDPQLRSLWLKIAADETRHAELAWRFVRWAIGEQAPELRDAARAEFEALLTDVTPQHCDESQENLAEHGIVGEHERRAIRSAVLARVVAPCARKVVETYAGGAQVPAIGETPFL